MSNMSYCRFQNTYGDAAECLDALEQQKRTQRRRVQRRPEYVSEFLRSV